MALAAATLGAPGIVSAQSVSFQGLGFLPGGTTSQGNAVSADGTTAVGWGDASGTPRQAFSWKAGTITGLTLGGNAQSFATGVNSNGTVIVGVTQAQPSFALAPVMWTNGTLTTLPQNKSSQSVICGAQTYGVNANATGPSSSVVVGQDASGTPGCGPGIPVNWTNGVESSLAGTGSGITQGANAAGSVLVGQIGVNRGGTCNPCTQAFSNATILGDFGGNFSVAYATNADGTVAVGSANVDNTNSRPFRWTSSTGLVALGPAAIFAQALAVNGDGSVVVGQMHNNGPAFRWTASTGFQNLQTLLTANGVDITTIGPAPNNTWTRLVQATGISSDGATIVGSGGGPGSATQAWIATLPIGATTQANTHDFNHDGMSDLLWRDTSGNTAVWLMNGGSVTSSAGLGQLPPATWSIIGQRDFNGDGNADILWRDASGNVSMWFMNGTQVTSSAVVASVPTNWTVYGTGDLNSDGKGDLLWRDSTTGNLSAWHMNGNQVVSQALVGSVPTNWTIARTDAHGDIFWRDNSGNLAMWQIHGTQVVASAGYGIVPLNWSIAGVGDFNGDGNIDILWRDSNSGAVSIWFLKGTQVSSTAGLGTVPTTFAVAQTGDYNGDGMSDIVWMDGAGNTSIWFMNGSTIASTAGLGNVGTTWQVQALNAE
jgi:uncharacterized membrane protein